MRPECLTFGRIVGGLDTSASLRIYDIPITVDADAEAARMGWTAETFSFPDRPPDFRRSYGQRVAWIYDPAISHGAFRFNDWTVEDAVRYTRAWRISHEIGHGETSDEVQAAFGPGRRKGRLGDPLTAREASRALAWEDRAFHAQRQILDAWGVAITDDQFAREWRVNMADAVHRVLTGDFSDPGPEGFMPHAGTLDRIGELEAACAACSDDVLTEYRDARRRSFGRV